MNSIKDQCIWIQPTNITPMFTEYLNYCEWFNYIYCEEILYQWINGDLDFTINETSGY